MLYRGFIKLALVALGAGVLLVGVVFFRPSEEPRQEPTASRPAESAPAPALAAPGPSAALPPGEEVPLAPRLEPAPDPEASGPVTATAVMTKADGRPLALQAINRLFPQVALRAGEAVKLSVDLAGFRPDQDVIVSAANGGTINGRSGSLRFRPAETGGRADFEFRAGSQRGRCLVEVEQGAHTELMEFWVGAPLALGEPGPPRSFAGPGR